MNWGDRHTVLVPVDFSAESLKAVDEGLDLAESTDHLHVVHVLPPLHPGEPGVIWGSVDSGSRREHAEEALRKELSDPRYTGAHLHFVEGDAGKEIAALAEELAADLIVIPSHGRTGLRRLLIGSVAERVVRLSHCPVLVLRGPAPARG